MKVLVVDDHAVVRDGLRRLLVTLPNVEIFDAATGREALSFVQRQQPDLILLDLHLPGIGGIELLRRLISMSPNVRILVFSMHEDAMRAERAIQLGARGYVTKSSAPEVLAKAIVEVAAGKLYLSADVAQAIAQSKLTGEDHPLKLLTAREFEIFRLLVAGNGPTEIAAILSLSAKTVANNRTLINQKLRTSGDVELMLLAMRHKLL